MNRSSLVAVGFCALLAASPAFSQSRGSSGGGMGGGSSSSGNSGFGDFGGGFSTNQYQFGDLSQFGQSTGMNALSSGIGTPATGLGLPGLSGNTATARNGTRTSSRSSSPSSSFGSISQNRGGGSGGGSGGGLGAGGRSTTGRSVTGMTGQRSPGRTGNTFGMNGMTGMNAGGRGGRSANRAMGVQQSVRPVIRVGLDDIPAPLNPAAIAQTSTASFSQNRLIGSLQQVQVNVDATGTATIRGTAQTDHQRTLAAAMLSLDPGVRAVRNEIAVPAQPSLPASR